MVLPRWFLIGRTLWGRKKLFVCPEMGHNDDLLSDPEFLIRPENISTLIFLQESSSQKNQQVPKQEAHFSILFSDPNKIPFGPPGQSCASSHFQLDGPGRSKENAWLRKLRRPRTTILLHSKCPKRPVHWLLKISQNWNPKMINLGRW